MHASTAKYQTLITGNPQAQEQLKKQSSLKTYKMTGVFFFFSISFQSRVSPHMQSNAFSTKDIDALSLATLNNILISLSNQLVFHISVFAIHFFHIFSYLILACKYLTKGSLTVNFLSFLTNCCFFISLKMA